MLEPSYILEEGIDVLAESCGKGEEVAAWTRKAMGGSVPFEDALAARLNLIQPTTDDLHRTLRERPAHLSPGIQDLFSLLKKEGKTAYLVSGGFTQMIAPVAEQLKVPSSRIYANTILFDKAGKFAGFDKSAPTSKSGGKGKVRIEMINMFEGVDNRD